MKIMKHMVGMKRMMPPGMLSCRPGRAGTLAPVEPSPEAARRERGDLMGKPAIWVLVAIVAALAVFLWRRQRVPPDGADKEADRLDTQPPGRPRPCAS